MLFQGKRKARGEKTEGQTGFGRPIEQRGLDGHDATQCQSVQTHQNASRFSSSQVFQYQWDPPPTAGRSSEFPPSLISLLYPSGVLPPKVASDVALNVTPAVKQPLIPPILPYLNKSSSQLPLPPIYFPLSPDYRLITLFQYNVLRATLTNMSILSILHRIPTYCLSALQIPLVPQTSDINDSAIPPSLMPTILQQTVPHDYWIDLMPSAQMRDNLILNYGLFDEDELCGDMVGGLYDGFDDVQNRGIIVWGEPWDENGWEISEGFAKKWGFLLKGCVAAIRATNVWREQRGEESLSILEV
jgi:hypothetical protein